MGNKPCDADILRSKARARKWEETPNPTVPVTHFHLDNRSKPRNHAPRPWPTPSKRLDIPKT